MTDKHRRKTTLSDSMSAKSTEGWQQSHICQCGLKERLRCSVSLCAPWLGSANRLEVWVRLKAVVMEGLRQWAPVVFMIIAHTSMSHADTVPRCLTCLDYKVHQCYKYTKAGQAAFRILQYITVYTNSCPLTVTNFTVKSIHYCAIHVQLPMK